MSIMAAKMIGLSVTMSSTSSPPPSLSTPSNPVPSVLPVRSLPGSYGWPVLGPLKDRLDYFWFQGPDTYFRKRIEKNKSTVFRTNIPPCFPFFVGVNPNVVAVLDCKSFAHLFDMELVDKSNILVGDFMPSVKFTGDMRVCAYLDTTEPQHSKIKNFSMDILKRSSSIWVSELTSSLDTFWDTIESEISKKNSSSYLIPLQKSLFTFLSKCLIGADPAKSPEIAESGYFMIDKWLAFQLLPTLSINVLQPLEELFLHSFAYPFFLIKGDYQKLYNFVESHGQQVLQRATDEFGLGKQEAIHNLLFILGFNAYGGLSVFLPSLISQIGKNASLQEKLRKEVQEKCGSSKTLSFEMVRQMELVNSVVYEALRFSPPVPQQFGRARKDFKLSTYDSVYEIKKGEVLCGFQPLVMRDPKIFDEPDTFKPDRFMGDGKELLNYLYWSNGPQTGTPSESNKQCAAKDYVTLTAALFVAHLFSRYESFSGDASSIKAVQKV